MGFCRRDEAGFFCRGWKFSLGFARFGFQRKNGFGRIVCRLRTRSRRSSEITREIEDEGFVHVGDAGWDWEDYRQFFRLFYREEDRAQAAICLNEQRDFSFYYLRISSRAKGGTVWTTWNDPGFPTGLKLTPLYSALIDNVLIRSFWQLYQSHRDFLRRKRCEIPRQSIPLDEEQIETRNGERLRDQIAHNIHKGVLKADRSRGT